MTTIKKESLVIRVNPKLKQRLEKLAKSKNINTSELARDLLEAGLRVEEERNSQEKLLIKAEIERIDKEIHEKQLKAYDVKKQVEFTVYDVIRETGEEYNAKLDALDEVKLSGMRNVYHELEAEINQLKLTKEILLQKL